MMLLAQLTDKEKSEKIIADYEQDLKRQNKDQQQSETVKLAGHQNQTRQYLYLS